MSTTRYFDYSRAMTNSGKEKKVTKKQLAQLIGVSESTIYRMVKDGRLPKPLLSPNHNNGGWLRATIDKWLDSHCSN